MQAARKISLISKSDIRYEGLLYSINPEENTVALRDVRMYGTEGRRDGAQVPPSDQAYEFIVFRGSDIKDLTVFEQPEGPASLDPSIVSTTAPAGLSSQSEGRSQHSQNRGFFDQPSDNQRSSNNRGFFDQPSSFGGGRNSGFGGRHGGGRHGGGRHGGREGHDRLPSHGGHYGGGRGSYGDRNGGDRHGGIGGGNFGGGGFGGGFGGGYGGRGQGFGGDRRRTFNLHTGQNFTPNANPTAEYTEEFDFAASNQNLDKDNLAAEFAGAPIQPVPARAQSVEDIEKKYSKDSSFFDMLSCESLAGQGGRPDREDREKQKKIDIATFGSVNTGGYGYGARGGRRGRGGRGMGMGRGGPRGGGGRGRY